MNERKEDFPSKCNLRSHMTHSKIICDLFQQNLDKVATTQITLELMCLSVTNRKLMMSQMIEQTMNTISKLAITTLLTSKVILHISPNFYFIFSYLGYLCLMYLVIMT